VRAGRCVRMHCHAHVEGLVPAHLRRNGQRIGFSNHLFRSPPLYRRCSERSTHGIR
jgi:hypothetical protein